MSGECLTTAATLLCPHGGSVTIVASSTKVQAGSPIVTVSDTFTIAGCSFTLPGPTPSPCVRVQWIVPGLRVKVGGAQALDTGSSGLCLAASGAPQGPVSIQPGQTKAKGS